MKKSLLALAVLGAYAGVASAQSSVQLFGTLDVNGRYIKNDGRDRQLSMSDRRRQQQRNPLPGHRRPGRRPEGGLQPALRHQLRTPAPRGRHAKFWNRRATVSLYTNAGELRLGRDYVPTFWTTAIFDAFGYNGIGSIGQRPARRARAARQLDRLLPAEQPRRLLRPGDGRCGRERHERRPERSLHRRPVRLPRRPVRHRGCVLGKPPWHRPHCRL